MGKLTKCILTIMSCAVPLVGTAQDDFDAFKKKMDSSFDSFKMERNNEYEAFRKRVNDEYAAMLEKSWKEFNAFAKLKVPEEKPIPPVVYPKEDEKKPKPKPKPLPYDTVIPAPKPVPQPEPVAPIEDKPQPITPIVSKLPFTFFGTQAEVRFDSSMRIELGSLSERSISKAWKEMSTEQYSNLVYDCLQIRKQKVLCDWAYLEMLRCLSEKVYGKGTNSATLLMAYIYCQSGYQMRFAMNGNKLYLMYASDHIIYNVNFFRVDGVKFYPYGNAPGQLHISDVSFPHERSMSLFVSKGQLLAVKTSPIKTRQSKRYPEVKTTMTSNLNLMEFYNTYPTSMIGENMVTRWAMYANTPMSESVKQQIYPSLRTVIKGCNQLTAVNKLLNYVQTGFVYEYDEKVWGHDRAFFAEESLYYPYCDCEDRSILFTRLVRDLLGLKCILIYYPGHLASAVEFTEGNIAGDYILLNNRKFIVADATYINAPVGKTMPKMDNKTAQVILLN